MINTASFERAIAAERPLGVAFVGNTAATWYVRGLLPDVRTATARLGWTVGGAPALVLLEASGANNGMPVPLRLVLWSDLADFLDQERHHKTGQPTRTQWPPRRMGTS